MTRSETSCILLLILSVYLHGELQSQKYISSRTVKKAIREFIRDSSMRSASISFSLIDLRNAKKVVSFDEHRSLEPASSQKIISSAFVLNELSDNYRFQTPFILKGDQEGQGKFNGNLEIIGKGDPSFASEYYPELPKIQSIADTLSSRLKARGVIEINGNILVNEEFITDIPENKDWLWYDLGNYYGAGCFAFNYAENQASISLEAAKQEGGICTILRVVPNQLSSNYTSKVIGKSQSLNPDVFVLGSSQSCKQDVLGEWKCCSNDTLTIRSALIKPSDVFVRLLKDALKQNGITIREMNITPVKKEELIYTYSSPVLSDLVQRALYKSVNLYCESFVHLIGYKINGTTDRQNALREMSKMLSNCIKNSNGVVLEDGSGLSPKNMISSSAFVEFLQWIHNNQSLHNFWRLLPDICMQGSLIKWLKPKPNVQLQMKLKSGSMERVRSFTGFLVHDERPVYAMSLLVNHYSCNGDKMNELIAKFLNHIQNNR